MSKKLEIEWVPLGFLSGNDILRTPYWLICQEYSSGWRCTSAYYTELLKHLADEGMHCTPVAPLPEYGCNPLEII